jgi:hypothetical protein
MMAEAYGSMSCAFVLVPESKLSHRLEAQHSFIMKLIHHDGKTPRFALKNIFRDFSYRLLFPLTLSLKKVFNVFPLEMSYVAKQRVVMSGLVWELAHSTKL